MDIVYDILVVLHLLGMALIVAGVVMRLTAAQSPNGMVMLSGAGAQVITGFALTGIASAGLVDNDVNNTKIAVKLGVAVIVLVLAHIVWRKPQGAQGVFYALAGLTLVNIGVAVFW
ncbi:hypothetical protein [Saccharomonospora glauca]|jgi:hypothetical protein|uniref:Integral membrane protein n=1 Tax=Saccharomonospora glauca K62 TaxID=928724 RepID=I1D7M7_9PSEU|nr:hypothetical protein [Saccharomonospora glauca]EIF00952.1 hypothetical protein SacglDRAFT_04120 [Saccharomonospora glauca K62]